MLSSRLKVLQLAWALMVAVLQYFSEFLHLEKVVYLHPQKVVKLLVSLLSFLELHPQIGLLCFRYLGEMEHY